VFGGIAWQRCQYQLQHNASSYVPRKTMMRQVAADIRAVFNVPDRTTAEAHLAFIVRKYEKTAPRLEDWMEKNIPEGLTFFDFPIEHWRRIHSTNLLERVNKKIKRRTKVVGVFP